MAVTIFETFLEKDGPQDAKTGDDGEQFRMSERQRVRGTAVDSYFCESRGNLVSNTVMPPFIPHNLLKTPFAFFVCFAVRLMNSGIVKKKTPWQKPRGYIATIFKLECQWFLPNQE